MHSSYLYFGKGLKIADIENPSVTVLAADKPGNHNDDGINVLCADGHVEKINAPTVEAAAKMRALVIPGK